MKKKIVRANEVPYLTKVPRTAIMKRSELKSNHLKNRNQQNKNILGKQFFLQHII